MLNEHDLRRRIVGEMHLRRWPHVCAPSTIIQFVRVLEPDQREAELRCVETLPSGGVAGRSENPRHRAGSLGPGIAFGWERQSEASTTTLFIDRLLVDAQGTFAPDPAALEALSWAKGMPGKVLRAIRVLIVPDEDAARTLIPAMGYDPLDLVSCHISCQDGEQAARVWSDFRFRDEGYGQILVAANGMAGGDLSRSVQRLQELGNYRNLALLGLPVAQDGWKLLDRIEDELSDLTSQVADPEVRDDDLLSEVTRLSMELIAHSTETDYRLSATEAYATIVEDRLEGLHIRACPGHPSLADFTQRRFLPAVRTCAAHRRREEQLAQRTERLVSLLRTRVETRIENQNGRLLASMERSSTRQLRLQQLVEGLSVVALSYYGISLIAHMLEGVELLAPHFHAHLVVAALTPVMVIGMYLGLHHLKKRILD
ncbi:DUF3422 domain-containing protein [Novosphingobium decolorationis]|uniref:DUF3422 domain-containing protein n=1 Tax=Novosphingobium decolorationis TaxID=2698673 RepID=A0ABX8E7N7_9SPHN|nr:DUF3422 domain-containing protein [Novosphingobium decolorationis]QVM85143.1 DUF3422 domain-containing protein [Novosphingobium decolorationis]